MSTETNSQESPRHLPSPAGSWRLRNVAGILLFAIGVWILWSVLSVGEDHLGRMSQAIRLLRTSPPATLEARRELEETAKRHRDTLVDSGRLVHSRYAFTNIPCPSPEAAWLGGQLTLRDTARVESWFSSSGRSSYGEYYEVNVWIDPTQKTQWDDWFEQHNDLEYVRTAMPAASHSGSHPDSVPESASTVSPISVDRSVMTVPPEKDDR